MQYEDFQKEWSSAKGKAFNVLFGLLVVFVGYGVWVGTIQTRLSSIENQQIQIDMKVEEISRRQQLSDITGAEIKTKLINIEASLLEIKNTLKVNR